LHNWKKKREEGGRIGERVGTKRGKAVAGDRVSQNKKEEKKESDSPHSRAAISGPIK